MNTYSSWLGQKGNRLVHSVKYKNIRTFSCLRQQMFFCSRRRRRQRQRRQREQQKSNRFILAKQQLCTCITLSRHCTITTWNCLISRFVEDVNTRQRLSFSFPELWNSLYNSTPEKFINIWRIERVGISAIKFEVARIHWESGGNQAYFLSDVFVAVAMVVA